MKSTPRHKRQPTTNNKSYQHQQNLPPAMKPIISDEPSIITISLKRQNERDLLKKASTISDPQFQVKKYLKNGRNQPNNDATEEAPPISRLRPSILNEVPKEREKLEKKKAGTYLKDQCLVQF
ncbi:hypothetical protein F8M41_021055 [Gigaspora margarita]|uniref:Uncharacterized protein n=1 Tax=Gigaspora margarita TaxID=4874 RepID=A0A8H3WW52_GIGMA|nr:hypothetical protein F8M41_021055 [Gigaspora margarita]